MPFAETTQPDHDTPDYSPDYVMGRNDAETRRLEDQALLYHGATEPVLKAAGLAPGMVVLDVGCGAGDVAMIAAGLVGPGGRVVALDIDLKVIERARVRAERAGYRNIEFIQGDARNLTGRKDFDAAIGRLVLLHQKDPVGVLAAVSQLVRPGGIIAFCELDIGYAALGHPRVELYAQVIGWIRATLGHAGFDTLIGRRLHQVFRAAQLPTPSMMAFTPIGGAADWPGFTHIADTLRSVMPHTLKFGIATEEEIDIDSLSGRLRDAAVSCNATLALPALVGAWTVKP
jgi:2-polyprenyl-3-methyl-5-hydroxy-6-metoxy-1,4-benzoquinol methylase